ncbi:MAG: hypothetical protein RR631_05845, partial [Erysipelothrix sp.]
QRLLFQLVDDFEIKSTLINKKNFKFGINSFNDKALRFYFDFFSLISEIKPIIQITAISKMEYYLRCLLKNIEFPSQYVISNQNFYYTMTKLFIFYHNNELNKTLFDSEGEKNITEDTLIQSINTVLEAIKDIPRKRREYLAFENLAQLINDSELNISPSQKIDFRYYPNFDGLTLLLNELSIKQSRIKLTIDEEDSTFNEAKSFSFGKLNQADSKNAIQLHLSDILSGFLGRMMYAISNDASMKEDHINEITDVFKNDLTTKRILSPSWFELDKNQFELYQLIYNALVINNQHHWSLLTLSYSDQILSLFELFKYIGSFPTYDSFKNITVDAHSENHNSWCCSIIDEAFEK